MKEALCKAFCDALTVWEVPVGLAVGTPFMRGGERLAFYVVYDRHDPSRARLEDDTLTITLLDAAGVDLFEGPRSVAFADMMEEAGVTFDEEEGVLHTPFMPLTALPSLAIGFAAFLLRVQDFMLLTRERVEETFKDDVIRAVKSRFEGRAAVIVNAPPQPDLKNYVADAVVQASRHPPLALYIGKSENKALEALVLHQATKIRREPCNVMLIVPTQRANKVKGKTKARMVEEFPVVPFIGNEAAALNEMERLALGEDARVH